MITSSERTDDVVLPNLLPSPLCEREVVIMICPSLIPRPTIPGLPGDVGVDAVNRGVSIRRVRVRVITSSTRPGDVIVCLLTLSDDYVYIYSYYVMMIG